MCGPGIFVVSAPDEILKPCSELMAQLQREAPRLDEGNTQFALQLLSLVAMQAQDLSLADAVAEFCIEKSRELSEEASTISVTSRLLECAGANSDSAAAMEVLARRLEGVSYLAPASALTDLYDSLSHLQLLDDRLSNTLGSARAASRLGGKA